MVELWVGDNIMRLMSFLYIVGSHTAHAHNFSFSNSKTSFRLG